jgi:polyribonucleotide 5'-hydroxyl-kinase
MVKNYEQKPTSSASAAHSDERITVVKLSKSGGCVDRDEAFMKAINDSQIRSYFFGNAAMATTASAAAASTALPSISSSSKITLSPHTQQLDFDLLALYNYTVSTSSPDEDDDDEYDPSQFTTGDSYLPGGIDPSDYTPSQTTTITTTTEHSQTTSYDTAATTSSTLETPPLKKFSPPLTQALSNTLIAITYAPTNAPLKDIQDSSIMGFVYVADVDVEKKKLRVLAPVGGRMPAKALIWGKKWPGEVVGLVG